MNVSRRAPRALLTLLLGSLMASTVHAASPGNTPAALATVRDAAMQGDWAYQRLSDLTDLIGPRLSGSPGANAAVEQVADAMRKLGAKVTLQPVKVPHWVRGTETGELVEYAGRPAGITQRVVLTALGGSGPTPAAGLTAPVLVVHSFDELSARAAEVKGRIVLFDLPFDQDQADRGLAGQAYGQVAIYRYLGPRKAQEMGAAAALIRSVGGADFRIAHTGSSGVKDGGMPAAAVTAEDAMLIGRLAARGPVSLHLTVTSHSLPDADSFNVIADWPGSDKADEVVIVSGHLDSWDLGTGAIDDGAGVAGAVRVIAWMNEEIGGRGAVAYHAANKAKLEHHLAAIVSDSGAGRPFGLLASVSPKAEALLAPLMAALQPIGAGVLRREEALGTGDLSELESDGVPSFEPLVDTHAYFHYHHTAADTLDKVAPDNLRRHVAVMATTAWFLANMEQPLGRAPAQAK